MISRVILLLCSSSALSVLSRRGAARRSAAVEASSTFDPIDRKLYTAAFGACASGEAALALLERMGERGVDADARGFRPGPGRPGSDPGGARARLPRLLAPA